MFNTIKSSPSKYFYTNWSRQKHSLKTAIACILGILCAYLFRLSPQWVIITIFVVMSAQPRVGAVIQKSIVRLVGTFIGAIIATLVLLLFQHDLSSTFIALVISALFFSYLGYGKGILSDGSTLGAATVALVLLTPNATVTTAISRFFEISLGIIIAFLVSSFILPAHSKTRLIKNISSTLNDLEKLFVQQMQLLQTQIELELPDAMLLEEQIINAMATQRTLFPEVKRESFMKTGSPGIFKNILQSEKEILRSISFISAALEAISPAKLILLIEQPIFREFNAKVVDGLTRLSEELANKQITGIVQIQLRPDWQQHLKQLPVVRNMSTEEILHLDAFIFCAEYLVKQLQILAQNIQRVFINT